MNDRLPDKIYPDIDKTFGNLTDKLTTRIGDTFADLWYLAFGWIGVLTEEKRYKNIMRVNDFKDKCNNQINSIPENDLKEPDYEMVCSVLDGAKFCLGKEELRKMFSILLAKTASCSYSSLIHPSFPIMLSQLSSLDAKVFSEIYEKVEIPAASLIIKEDFGFDELFDDDIKEKLSIDGDEPILTDMQGEGETIPPRLFAIPPLEEDYYSLAKAVDNLVRLGLVIVDYNSSFAPDEYDGIRKDRIVADMMSENKHFSCDKKFFLHVGKCIITELGKDFGKVCLCDEYT